MRILYLCPSGQVGGAERSLLVLLARLDRSRFAPTALVGSPGPLIDELQAQHVPCRVVALPEAMRRFSSYHGNPGLAAHILPVLQLPAYVRDLARAGRSTAPALVHSNGLKMHLLGALLRRSWQAPLVWHLRDFPPARGAGLIELAARRADLAIANSAAVADAYAGRFPSLSARLAVVHNGVELNDIDAGTARQARLAARARWGLPAQSTVIGMVGIFAPWKGHEVFLRAAREALASNPALRFLLVGADIYDTRGHGQARRDLEALSHELGLGESVCFTGYLGDDVGDGYAAMDILVHAATRPEPFGRTLIEAMAAGVAVISTGLGGSREVVRDGAEAIIAPPGDAAALSAAMLRLAGDHEFRLRLAAAGRQRVNACFSAAAHARRVEALYDELLGHRARVQRLGAGA